MSLRVDWYERPWFLVAGVIVLVATAFGVAAWCSAAACADVSAQVNAPTKWSWLSGCYVFVEDKWVPLDRWRVMESADARRR